MNHKIFDQVVETVKAVYINRKEHVIKIDLDKPLARTKSLFPDSKRENAVNGDSDDWVDFKAWQWDEKL